MENTPKVSVIIPVYNTEKYLRQCLDSVANQTLRDIEIICINDASTDKSSEILNDFAANDHRIKVITYETNKSASQARKDGVQLASGEYIMFLDADDYLELCACEELSKAIDKHDVDILQFGTYIHAEPTVKNTSIEFFTRFVTPYTKYLYGHDVFDACFRERKFRFNLWNKIYSADLCKRAFSWVEDGPFPKAQDLYAFFIIAWEARSYYGIKNKYYHYNYGRGITGGGHVDSLDDIRRHCSQSRVAQKCREFLKIQGMWPEYEAVWNRMNADLINECISHWINYLPDSDGADGFDILVNHWGIEEIKNKCKKDHQNEMDYIVLKSAGAKVLNGKLLSDNLCETNDPITPRVDMNDADIPENFNQIIPIVFATNNNYAPYLGVAIGSLIKRADGNKYYSVSVLHTKLTPVNQQKLENMSTRNVQIRCVNASVYLPHSNLYEKAHFTEEMYFRILIPQIFPQQEKVLYLDCDLVLCEDVAKLYEVDINQYVVGMGHNFCTKYRADYVKNVLKLSPEEYFNSGVILFNCKKFREENIAEKCFSLLDKYTNLDCPDQDILNLACGGKIFALDSRWNVGWQLKIQSNPRFHTEEEKELYNEVTENPYIVHFTSGTKPWNEPGRIWSHYFWEAARTNIYYEEILFTAIGSKRPISGKLDTKARHETDLIRASRSYRIGRAITYIPRKIRGGIQCCRDHGLDYTMRYAVVKLKWRLGAKK